MDFGAAKKSKMTNLEDMIEAAARTHLLQRIAELEAEYAQMLEAEHAMIADCVRSKSAMPANYWHPRHHVGELLKAARRAAGVA